MRGVPIRVLLAGVLATVALSATAEAAPIVFGSQLTGKFAAAELTASGTLAMTALPQPALAASPVNGVIVRWTVIDTKGAAIRLRVLRPAGPLTFLGAGVSAPVAITSAARQTFVTSVPIAVGDLIGIDGAKGDEFGVGETSPGSLLIGRTPPLGDGATEKFAEEGPVELAFNAEVQPVPTITGLSATSGSVTGSSLTISGTDFEGTRAVRFGSVPATFAIASEGALTVAVPPSAALGTVPVTVTTVAGTATSSFSYVGCTVPKVTGFRVKAARKKVRLADCGLGRVAKVPGAKKKRGKIRGQRPMPGTILAPDSTVKVKVVG